MLRKFCVLLALPLALAAPTYVRAATLNLSIVINSPPSTSITCPMSATLTAPVPAGTVLCTLTVAPTTWSGTLALSGTNASLFAIASGSSGTQLVVGASPITTPGTYSATITATP
jgi:hypothetical protein